MLAGFLGELYSLSPELLKGNAAVNFGYGLYSFLLAVRAQRPKHLLVVLVSANAAWSILCFVAVGYFWGEATLWGMAHLFFEGTFVGGLAYMEWIQRDALRSRD